MTCVWVYTFKITTTSPSCQWVDYWGSTSWWWLLWQLLFYLYIFVIEVKSHVMQSNMKLWTCLILRFAGFHLIIFKLLFGWPGNGNLVALSNFFLSGAVGHLESLRWREWSTEESDNHSEHTGPIFNSLSRGQSSLQWALQKTDDSQVTDQAISHSYLPVFI